VNLSLPLPSPPADGCPPALATPVAASSPGRPFFIAAPETLHPALWRAHQLGAAREAVTPSGFGALDVQLPGGGWPHRVLSELLLPHPGLGEMRLLAPALAALAGGSAGPSRCVMLFDPPAAPCAWALGQLGLDARQWLVVHGRVGQGGPGFGMVRSRRRLPSRLAPGADVLWALEQALRSGHLGAVLAWLPAACQADVLRRLQLAAQAHDGPVFVFRGLEARSRPSVAPLRLALAAAGIDALAVRVLKRRGPALAEPLTLALSPVLGARQRERSRASQPQPAPVAWVATA